MTTTSKLKNPSGTVVPDGTHEERLWDAYKCILTGLFSQFDRPLYCDLHGEAYINWNALLDHETVRPRSKQLVRIAMDAAIDACTVFAEQETIATFDRKVTHAK